MMADNHQEVAHMRVKDDGDTRKRENTKQKAEDSSEKESEEPELQKAPPEEEEEKESASNTSSASSPLREESGITTPDAIERKDSPDPKEHEEPKPEPEQRPSKKKPTQPTTLEMFWDPIVRELGKYPASDLYVDLPQKTKKKRYRPVRQAVAYAPPPPPPPSFDNNNPPSAPLPPPLVPAGPLPPPAPLPTSGSFPPHPAQQPVSPPAPANKPNQKKSRKARKKAAREKKGEEDKNSSKAANEASDDEDIGILPPSAAEAEWERLKREEKCSNFGLDMLMDLTGIEDIKQHFLDVRSWIGTARRQGVDMHRENYNLFVLGNPGSGKSTVAGIYGCLLFAEGVLHGGRVLERSAVELATKAHNARRDLEHLLDGALGGAYLVDEVHQLAFTDGGKDAIDELLYLMNNEPRVNFIFAGNAKEMEDFFSYAPNMAASAHCRVNIPDFSEKEIHHTIIHRLRKRYDKKMRVDDSETGKYTRIVARRVGRGSGKDGFANLRTLENTMLRIYQRQAKRLEGARTQRPEPDDYTLTKDDILGLEPRAVFDDEENWKHLHEMVGLESVKQSVQVSVDILHLNFQRELLEKEPVEVGLCKVFVGPPGTGKSTVAKSYGKLLAKLGLLSKGDIISRTATDLLGDSVGESERRMKNCLKASTGSVLLIDEAHTLDPTRRNGWDDTSYCEYRQGIIDTLVGMVTNSPGEDRCVILMGYPDEMKQLLSSANPGLARRFPVADAFVFESFNDAQLAEILDLKLKKQGLQITPEARTVALKQLTIARQRPTFGNGSEVENLLTRAKENYQKRQSKKPLAERLVDIVLEHMDFDPDHARTEGGIDEVDKMFEEFVGFDKTIATFRRYQRRVRGMRARGLDPNDYVPFTFVFKGSPGTGKTSTARKIGKLYYNMGFLAAAEVVEVSVKDMVGNYLGQSPTKTNELLVSAIGKVLFIDEAYRLDSDKYFQEALDQLVDCLSKPKFEKKLLIVLAGYDGPMDTLMTRNPGLRSRFPTEITFANLSPSSCFQLVKRRIEDAKIGFADLDRDSKDRIESRFRELSETNNWGNGRDVVTVAVDIIGTVYEAEEDGEPLEVTGSVICDCLQTMLKERKQDNTQLEHLFL